MNGCCIASNRYLLEKVCLRVRFVGYGFNSVSQITYDKHIFSTPLLLRHQVFWAQMHMKSYVVWLTESKPHPTSLTLRHAFSKKYLTSVAVQRGNAASILGCAGLDLDVSNCVCLELDYRPRYYCTIMKTYLVMNNYHFIISCLLSVILNSLRSAKHSFKIK